MIIESTTRSFIGLENYSQGKEMKGDGQIEGVMGEALHMNSFKQVDIGDFHHEQSNS